MLVGGIDRLKIVRLPLREEMLENPSLTAEEAIRRAGEGADLILEIDTLPLSRISAELIRFEGPAEGNIEKVREIIERGAFRFYIRSDNWRYPDATDRIRRCAEGDKRIADKLSGREVLAIYREGREELSPLKLDWLRHLIESTSSKLGLDSVYLLPPKLLNGSIMSSLLLPWDDRLPGAFKRACGEELFEKMPYLFITTHETLSDLGFFWKVAGRMFSESVQRLGCKVAIPLIRRMLYSAAIVDLSNLSTAVLDEGDGPSFKRRALLIKLALSSKRAIGIYTKGRIDRRDIALGLGEIMGSTRAAGEIGVIYPTLSILGTPDDGERERTVEGLADLTLNLMEMGYDFDLIPEPMSGFTAVSEYQAIIIPSCQTLASDTVRSLKGFTKRGKVASIHPPPYLVDGMGGQSAFELEEMLWRKVKIIREPLELEQFLSRNVNRGVNLYERSMNYPARSILIQRRSFGDSDLLILMSLSDLHMDVLMEIESEMEVEGINPDGSASKIDFWHADGRTYAEIGLDGGEMRIMKAIPTR